ncbi:hypothetical protein TW65_08429 [Stemphylium lycopersici]|uniref:RING-type domain-containing protein n=1 Tax=Stemphylium lycopersici TaxID=183478 RepID=A0A364MY33_STELY|nr:hypothetical protein TW65_08429 [Stemphylium lycopersici]RAR06823.1 hypothetical protein DDE83_006763 [Stemphylium lycopersici]
MASFPNAPLPLVPASCCTTCTSRRTCAEFLTHHVKTPDSTSEPICRICWQPFGSLNLRLGSTDDACQVINIPNCAHVFGSACLRNLVQTGSTCCPLCRAPWFTSACGSPYESEAQKRLLSSRTAARLQIDEEAARWFHYQYQWRGYGNEGEPFDQMDMDVEDGRGRGTREEVRGMENVPAQTRHLTIRLWASFENTVKTVKEAWIQDLITDLQDTQPSPLDHRLFNRVTGQQDIYAENNPWSFRNWHQSDISISTALFRALTSVSGERIRDMLETRLLRGENGVGGWTGDGRKALLACVEEEWVAWYGDEAVRGISRVVLHVLFSMRLIGFDWP